MKVNPEKYDTHIHIETSENTPEAVLELARKKKLVVGLVDHVFSDRNRITDEHIIQKCRMDFPDVHFLHGCEADAYGFGKIALSESQRSNMEFVIVSFTHLGEPGTLDGVNVFDKKQLADRLVELLKTAIEYPYTDIIAHPMSFSLKGIDSWEVVRMISPEVLATELIKIQKRQIAVEINARTLRNNDPRGQEFFIDLANRYGCQFTVASDAHYIKEVGRTEEAWKLIRRLRISSEKVIFPSRKNSSINSEIL